MANKLEQVLTASVLAAALAAGCAGPNRTTYYETTGFTPDRQDARGVNTFGASDDFRYGLSIEAVAETERRTSADYSLLPGAFISYQQVQDTSEVRLLPELRYLLHRAIAQSPESEPKEIDALYETTFGVGVEIIPIFRSSTIDLQVNGEEYPRLGVPGFGIDANFFLTWTHTLDLYLFEPAPVTGVMQYRVNDELDVDFVWGLGLRWGEPEQ
ncbi:MAG: hypothetical protein Q8R53_05635 [Nanoarchaeota archaeon]|nr:hypothetical protein [Nanoarchaeota archaeon]